MISISKRKLSLFVGLISIISFTNACFPTINTTTKPPVCCKPLTLDNVPRVSPPASSSAAGWDQCSLLTNHVDGTCPGDGMFICRVAPYTDAQNAHLQLIQNDATVVYESRAKDSVSIWVSCVEGVWKYEGKTFTQVSCSQK
uniref:C6 domain-containing protein n=1 Tax=Parastrongyloides trichosuri TaxID=131310 RepID=A0A0N4ZC95_PARTI